MLMLCDTSQSRCLLGHRVKKAFITVADRGEFRGRHLEEISRLFLACRGYMNNLKA